MTTSGPITTIVEPDASGASLHEMPARVRGSALLVRVALIVSALAIVAAAFAWLGGWFSPHELTPARFVNELEKVDGVHPGFRRNHTKGVCVSGFFDGNTKGVRFSKATVFQSEHVPVVGRFSLSGGNPFQADSADTVRGLGLQYSLPNGEVWRTAMVNLPVFPVSTPAAFYQQIAASIPDPATGKPDPEKMKSFVARHPEAARALATLKARQISSGFGNSTFHSLNAFRLVDSNGNSTPVRWLLKPVQPFEAAAGASPKSGQNFLFDGLIAQINRQPLQWHLIAIIGEPGDTTNDPSIAWPAEREALDVGTLTLDRVESEQTSVAREINFDPLTLPPGIEPSDDPFLSARSAIYSQSFTRRAGEAQSPSAITPAEIRKGN
jgi:catalase